MTAPDSSEHLPNHACYGRKIHDGYMRRGRKKKSTQLFVSCRQGQEQGKETEWGVKEEGTTEQKKGENFWCVELYLLKSAKLGLKPMMCLSFKVTRTVYAICYCCQISRMTL